MRHQQGIGLVEVMVALLLLALAVLGFSSMQMFAIKSTDESVMRTRAMTVIRGGSELMRANSGAIEAFKTALKNGGEDNGCMVATAGQTTNICTIEQLAVHDALALKRYAEQNELNIRLETCPGMTGSMARQCFIASWGKTKAEMSADDQACAKANGEYNAGAQCFIVEAY